MSKNLIIIESPGKIPSYKKYLGSDYQILASYGHVIDLPQKGGIGVDLKKDFKPTYEVMSDKKEVVEQIVRAAKEADMVYLMNDPDIESASIARHLFNQMPNSVKRKRPATSEITKSAILKATANAGDICMQIVDAYRRILYRLIFEWLQRVTEKFSRLWPKLSGSGITPIWRTF